MTVIIVDVPMVRVSVQHSEECVTDVVRKITLRKSADPVVDQKAVDLSQDMAQEDLIGTKENAHTDVICMKFVEKNVMMMTWRT